MQIVFWDETHTKGIIGDAAGRDFVYVFPRDANGELDANGTYSETSFQRLNMKYDNEVRLSLGCATAMPNDQEDRLHWEEITNKQVDGNYYPENLVTRLNGIGDARQSDWAKIGIYTLQDFIDVEGSIENRGCIVS